jgi:hypothetical protein
LFLSETILPSSRHTRAKVQPPSNELLLCLNSALKLLVNIANENEAGSKSIGGEKKMKTTILLLKSLAVIGETNTITEVFDGQLTCVILLINLVDRNAENRALLGTFCKTSSYTCSSCSSSSTVFFFVFSSFSILHLCLTCNFVLDSPPYLGLNHENQEMPAIQFITLLFKQKLKLTEAVYDNKVTFISSSPPTLSLSNSLLFLLLLVPSDKPFLSTSSCSSLISLFYRATCNTMSSHPTLRFYLDVRLKKTQ